MPAGTGLGITFPGIMGRFFDAYQPLANASLLPALSMRVESDSPYEDHKWLGAAPQFREWIGSRDAKQLTDYGVRITNKVWESTLAIDVEDIRMNRTAQIAARISDMAAAAADFPFKLALTQLVAGTGTTYGNAYDGTTFFSSSHVSGASGTQINDLSAAQVSQLNVATAVAPSQQEFADAVLGTIGYMNSWLDDTGESINHNARQFVVGVPFNLYGVALAAASQTMLTSGLGTVAGNTLAGAFKISVFTHTTLGTTANGVFYVFRSDAAAKPLIHQVQSENEVSTLGAGSDAEFKENKHYFGVKSVMNIGYGMWQYAARCTLS